MTRDSIIETLREHMDEIRRHGVAHLAVFGSVARGEERPDSDVDILVEFAVFDKNAAGVQTDIAVPAGGRSALS